MLKKRISVLIMLLMIFATGYSGAQDAPSSGEFALLFDVLGLTTNIPQTVSGRLDGLGITAISLSRGPALGPAGLTNGFAADNWVLANPSLDGAIKAGTYFEFGLSVDEGFTASLETLDLSLRRSAFNGPMNYELQASLDNFATPGITVETFTYLGRTSGTHPNPSPLETDPYYYMYYDLPGHPNTATSPGDPIPTIDLTAFEQFENIAAGTAITFRLYGWGNAQTVDTNSVSLGRMDGPKITGIYESVSK